MWFQIFWRRGASEQAKPYANRIGTMLEGRGAGRAREAALFAVQDVQCHLPPRNLANLLVDVAVLVRLGCRAQEIEF